MAGVATDSRITEQPASFLLTASDPSLLLRDAYSVAKAFIAGKIEVRGDLVEAVRSKLAASGGGVRKALVILLARAAPLRLLDRVRSRAHTAREIRFHYDRSNDFYRQFLDSRLVYSCAYFKDSAWSLEEAQLAKLEHICRKLDLRSGERFLDIGCGWGALVMHAADRYGAVATGCTLSRRQFEYAAAGAAGRAVIVERDYRDLGETFDKIASVGMFEHVGRCRLAGYFRKVHSLLAADGLFLNHGITRPEFVRNDAQTLFIERRVFPGGQIVHLSDVIAEADNAGFEVLDVENLRPHYALTCRAWVERLQHNASASLRVVDAATYRTWLLFLAGSAVAFGEGTLELHQVLMAKRGTSRRRMSRDYMYAGRGEAISV